MAQSLAESTEQPDEWRSVLSRVFVPLDPSPLEAGDERFGGSLRATDVDGLHVADVAGNGQIVRRTAATIRRADPALLKIGVQVTGSGLLEQDDREAELLPGDFALYDTTRPYRLRFDRPFRMLVVMCPRDALPVPGLTLRDRTAVAVRGASGIGAVVSPFLQGLGRVIEGPAPSARFGNGHLGPAVLDSLAAAFDDPAPAGSGASVRALLVRAQAHIDFHLADLDLGPDSIAAALHVSVRYLQRAFETDGETVSGWIRARRLERCRRDLRDPRLADRAISEVAARWGLANPAGFSRVFRAAFGMSPRDYRAGAHD